MPSVEESSSYVVDDLNMSHDRSGAGSKTWFCWCGHFCPFPSTANLHKCFDLKFEFDSFLEWLSDKSCASLSSWICEVFEYTFQVNMFLTWCSDVPVCGVENLKILHWELSKLVPQKCAWKKCFCSQTALETLESQSRDLVTIDLLFLWFPNNANANVVQYFGMIKPVTGHRIYYNLSQ